MSKIKILVVGSGAREHALVWKLAQSPKTTQIYAAPGNAGIAQIAQILDVKADDFEGLTRAVKENKIELIVVGPEAPLAAGIVDHFQKAGTPIFGPTRAAAQIESSKVFSKALMQKYGIPCARSAAFSDFQSAADYVKKQNSPLWIKADGLAAGKGAIFAESADSGLEILKGLMKDKTLGAAGDSVIIEECMQGREMSTFVFSDGQTVVHLADACDYKRINDGDEGLNTGGMGSYSPPYFHTPQLGKTVMETIMKRAIEAMKKEGMPYKGFLYGGLMITEEGPKVIEFNSRLGDPEAQVVLPRLKSDLVDIITAVLDGNLSSLDIETSEDACVGVAIASGGYPVNYKTGLPISGLDSLDDGVIVFHAATREGPGGEILTSGGRVLTVTSTGATLAEAREKVYANISRIDFDGCHYRKDIALIKQS